MVMIHRAGARNYSGEKEILKTVNELGHWPLFLWCSSTSDECQHPPELHINAAVTGWILQEGTGLYSAVSFLLINKLFEQKLMKHSEEEWHRILQCECYLCEAGWITLSPEQYCDVHWFFQMSLIGWTRPVVLSLQPPIVQHNIQKTVCSLIKNNNYWGRKGKYSFLKTF